MPRPAVLVLAMLLAAAGVAQAQTPLAQTPLAQTPLAQTPLGSTSPLPLSVATAPPVAAVAAAAATPALPPAAPAMAAREAPKTEGALQPTAATPAPSPTPAAPPKPEITLVARIDLTSQRLHVSVHGKPTHTWTISSGRRGFETPTGSFRPSWMARMWYSRTYDLAPMPHAVFFNGGIAVHATQATGMLGQPASHGCIRLAPAHAAAFYGLVSRHGLASTRVIVQGWPKFNQPAIAKAGPQPRDRQGMPRQVVASGYGYAQPVASDGFTSPFAALFGVSAPSPAPVMYRTSPVPTRPRGR
jgi:lipoprotein-anchoring transpeptidase ErfK/SrfK